MDERAEHDGPPDAAAPGTPDDRRLTDATGVIWKTDTATVTGAEALCGRRDRSTRGSRRRRG